MCSAWLLVLGVLGPVLAVSHTDKRADNDGPLHSTAFSLDRRFRHFVEKQHFVGATVGVMKEEQLVYADGTGKINGHNAHAKTLLPVLGLSKVLTAIAILKLQEEGKLSLHSKVFGKGGVLYFTLPKHGHVGDKRVYDITIEHLLRHTAGWDEGNGPVYDPMLNTMYVKHGYNVTNIAKSMNVRGIMNHHDIMQFMMSQPLVFTPGTKVKHSNFGYCVLGRIIEEKSNLPYEEYIRQTILVPSGMWRTRIGPPDTHKKHKQVLTGHAKKFIEEILNFKTPSKVQRKGPEDHSLFKIGLPVILDSTLGWYSNVYDMVRLFLGIFGGERTRLLKAKSVEFLISRPPLPYPQHTDTWAAIGFIARNDGSFWYESDDPILGTNILLYHKGGHRAKKVRPGKDVKQLSATSTLFFIGTSDRHRKHIRTFATSMLDPLQMAKYSDERVYISDLADSDLMHDGVAILIKKQIRENQLKVYLNAARHAGFYPTWLHSYRHKDHVYICALLHRARTSDQLDFIVHIFHSNVKLVDFITKHNSRNYHVKSLQIIPSSSERHQRHLLHMRKTNKVRLIELGVDEKLSSYLSHLKQGQAEGFSPVTQSVHSNQSGMYVSYVLQKSKAGANSYHTLTLQGLEDATHTNALQEYTLASLDCYYVDGKVFFSAVFRDGGQKRWALSRKITTERLTKEINSWGDMGYAPHLIVPYEINRVLHYVILWTA